MRYILFFLLITSLRAEIDLDALLAEAAILENQEGKALHKGSLVPLLEKSSMLYQAKVLAQSYSGSKLQWQSPYGLARPQKALGLGSVWFSVCPSAVMTNQESVLQMLGSKKLWDALQELGVQGLDPGPLQLQGKMEHGCGVDAPISLQIDPLLGTKEQYQSLVQVAKDHNGILIGSVIPGHTGKGPDFLLALKNYQDYPGLYHLIEIDGADWELLPKITDQQNVNLLFNQVDALRRKGYIPGEMESNRKGNETPSHWDATPIIQDVDGKNRRWVYLHSFTASQPDLNFLDPTFAAERLLSGSIVQSLMQGNQIIHLDTTSFQGIEKRREKRMWTKDHPLSCTTAEMLAELTRKLGGYSVAPSSSYHPYGADLYLDSTLYPAAIDALQKENATHLREVYQDAKPMVHSLQGEVVDPPSHILLAHLFALQPGVFTFTGWDLVGAKNHKPYDLLGEFPCDTQVLYGPLPKQLKDPDSFASQLKQILKARRVYNIDQAELVEILEPHNPALFLVLHKLPSTGYLQLTAVNFSHNPITEDFILEGTQNTSAINLINRNRENKPFASNKISLQFAPLDRKAIFFQPKYFQNQ